MFKVHTSKLKWNNRVARSKATSQRSVNEFAKNCTIALKEMCDPFTPRDTGKLISTAKIVKDKSTTGTAFVKYDIAYTQPYAKYHYRGNYDYSKSKNPKAVPYWDKYVLSKYNKEFQAKTRALAKEFLTPTVVAGMGVSDKK